MVLACLAIVLFAGPDDCQNMYTGAKRAPRHRPPDFVEVRQDAVLNYRDNLQLSYECVTTRSAPESAPLVLLAVPPL